MGESADGKASSEDSRLNGRPCLRRAASMALVVVTDDFGWSFLDDGTPGAWSNFGRGRGDLDFCPGGSLNRCFGVLEFGRFGRASSY